LGGRVEIGERPVGDEPEAAVVVWIANQNAAARNDLVQLSKRALYQCCADPLFLTLWYDSDGAKAEPIALAVYRNGRKRDMPQDLPVLFCDKRKAQRAGG